MPHADAGRMRCGVPVQRSLLPTHNAYGCTDLNKAHADTTRRKLPHLRPWARQQTVELLAWPPALFGGLLLYHCWMPSPRWVRRMTYGNTRTYAFASCS